MKRKLWTRTVTEQGERTEQFIEADEQGELWGWEVYENGKTSDRYELQTRTLPLGFYEVSPKEGAP